MGGDVAWPRGWFDANVEAVAEKQGMFSRIAPLLDEADLRFVNLETPLTDKRFAVKKKYLVATPPARFRWLVDAGFNLFSLANNHMADAGVEGVADTLTTLCAARDAGHTMWWGGADPVPARADDVVTFTPPGKTLKVAFIAVGNNRSKTVASPWARGLTGRITAARAQADLVIVSIHAGKEYHHVPAADVVRRYRGFVDAGAHLVIGHHPHVIQGVELRGDGVIFYSLGNFSFASFTVRHHKTGAKLYGMLPTVQIRDGVVAAVRVVPLYVNNRESWTLEGQPTLKATPFQPQPLTGAYARAVLEALAAWSAEIDGNATRFEIDAEEAWIRPDGGRSD